MINHLIPCTKDITQVYERHINTVYRVCFLYMKSNSFDLEDAVQTTFLKLIHSGKSFESTEHEKAWLITVAGNVCKNMHKSAWKRRVILTREIDTKGNTQLQNDETLQSVLALPHKYKASIYLHYYEGYTGAEIAKVLEKKESTIHSYLHRGRKMLSNMLKEETQ